MTDYQPSPRHNRRARIRAIRACIRECLGLPEPEYREALAETFLSVGMVREAREEAEKAVEARKREAALAAQAGVAIAAP